MELSTENLCNKCPPKIRGICCYFMVYLEHRSFTLTNHPCKYLNQKTGRCKIYHRRKEINPHCLSLEEMYLIGGLPKDCPYVKNDPKYQKRTDTRDAVDIPNKNKEEYDEYNITPHKEIAHYDTIRDEFCIKCNSPEIVGKWDKEFSICFFKYECVQCGHRWTTLKRQIQFTLKLISQSSNLPKTKNQLQNMKSIKKYLEIEER